MACCCLILYACGIDVDAGVDVDAEVCADVCADDGVGDVGDVVGDVTVVAVDCFIVRVGDWGGDSAM